MSLHITVGFHEEIAKLVGVNAAIIFERIRYFCAQAKLQNDESKFHEGRFWTYNSAQGWANSLPFLTKRQIDKALNELIAHKLIKVGNFNKFKYDRTRWYTNLVDISSSILPVGEIDIPELVKWKRTQREMKIHLNVNENTSQVTPIPKKSSKQSSNNQQLELVDEKPIKSKIKYNSVTAFEARIKDKTLGNPNPEITNLKETLLSEYGIILTYAECTQLIFECGSLAYVLSIIENILKDSKHLEYPKEQVQKIIVGSLKRIIQ